jgi:hypothetical protein
MQTIVGHSFLVFIGNPVGNTDKPSITTESMPRDGTSSVI